MKTMVDNQPNERAPLERVHGPDGTFIRTLDQAERDNEAARLRSRGLGYRTIAAKLDVAVSTAYTMVKRGFTDAAGEASETTLKLELAKLDNAEQAVLAVLEARHVTVSNGKVIYLGDEPLLDDAPVLAAVDRLVRIAERRARLLGLDAATKIDTTAQVKFVIEGVDPDAV
jgi:hypothetical protein